MLLVAKFETRRKRPAYIASIWLDLPTLLGLLCAMQSSVVAPDKDRPTTTRAMHKQDLKQSRLALRATVFLPSRHQKKAFRFCQPKIDKCRMTYRDTLARMRRHLFDLSGR